MLFIEQLGQLVPVLPHEISQHSGELVLVDVTEKTLDMQNVGPFPGEVFHPDVQNTVAQQHRLGTVERDGPPFRPSQKLVARLAVGRQIRIEIGLQALPFSQSEFQNCREFE